MALENINTKLLLIICGLCLLIGFCLGLSINRKTIETVTETKYIKDTIEMEIPIPIPEPYEVIRTEYILLENNKIINQNDSISLIPVPITEKTYETDKYKAVVGGYNPYLKSMTLFETTKVETITETKYKKPLLQLGIGTGVSYIPQLPSDISKFQPSFNISIYVPIVTLY